MNKLNKKNYVAMLALLFFWSMASAPKIQAAQGSSFVRVVHASPDSPKIDVYLDGELAFQGAAFRSISVYVPVSAKPYLLQVMPAGIKVNAAAALVSQTYTLVGDNDYTVVVLGKSNKLSSMILTDDNEIDDPTQAKVRLINLSPDSPAIDIVVPKLDGARIFERIGFKTISEYNNVLPGPYSFIVRPAGTDVNILDVKGLPLEAGSVTTIYAFGLWTGTPKFAMAISTDLRPQIMLPVTGG